VVEVQRRALLGSTLLTVYGIWQCEGEVRHLVARTLVDHTALLHNLARPSPSTPPPDGTDADVGQEAPGPGRPGLATRSRNFR
jgi:hypothetical protein